MNTSETNLFAQFSGADLDRLMECLKKIRSEGLSVDKYTQAGVNQSSGNVWVWSEDWAGCVYCSIGFDVAWSYSCPECGEEYDFDTEQECQEYAEKHEHQCEACNEQEEDDGLEDFYVDLIEAGETEAIIFECKAEDADHAKEQAENAYPGCKIVSVV